MKLAVQAWPRRGKHKVERGDLFGASVAHTDIIRAALRYNVVDEVHVLAEPSEITDTHSQTASPRGRLRNICGELGDEFGQNRVKLTSLSPSACDRLVGAVLLAGGPEALYLDSMRRYHKLSKTPLCTVIHSVRWDRYYGLYHDLIQRLRASDSIVATSTSSASILGELLGSDSNDRMGVDDWSRADCIVRVPLGVDVSIPLGRNACRAHLKLPLDGIYVLYFGRLSADSKAALEPLLIAFKQLSVSRQRLRLLIGGHDVGAMYTPALVALARELAIEDRVDILTTVSNDLKRYLYGAANIFISPVDNVQETFGLTILEAMAAGLPVVASDWSGYRDLIVHGQTGLLVPTYWGASLNDNGCALSASLLSDACLASRTVLNIPVLISSLRKLIDNPVLRDRMGAAGLERVSTTYSWKHRILQFATLWESQVHRAREGFPQNDIYSRLNKSQLFEQYASDVITPEWTVRREAAVTNPCASLGCNEDEEFWHLAANLWSRCTDEPQPISQLLPDRQETEIAALLWLIKRGSLAVGKGTRRPEHSSRPGAGPFANFP